MLASLRRAPSASLSRQLAGAGRVLSSYAAARLQQPPPPPPIPQELRRPFQQPNRRRDDKLLPRMAAAVPETASPYVQAWLSDWGEARAGIAQLRSDVWAMPLRPDIVHRVVTWQRACKRQGTSKTKSRHEVRGGGKKPRPQKGSGRSRQGSIRSPLWVGGGDAHPKRPRDFSYKLNLKVVNLGLKTALSDKYRRGALVVMRSLDFDASGEGEGGEAAEGGGAGGGDELVEQPVYGPPPNPHAADEALAEKLASALGSIGIDLEARRVMVITRHEDANADGKLLRASQHLRPLSAIPANKATVLDLVKHPTLVVSLDAITDLHHLLTRPRHASFVAATDDGTDGVARGAPPEAELARMTIGGQIVR